MDEKQEPVAWQCQEHGDTEWFDCSKEAYQINPRRYIYRALYTAPPQREWVGLATEDIEKIHYDIKCKGMGAYSTDDIYRAIEAKLKEKNT